MTPPLTMTCPRCWGSRHEPGSPNGCVLCLGSGTSSDLPLSPHFRLSEFLVSQTAIRMGLANDPSPDVVDALRDLCLNVLEPLRDRLGPLHIDSGYRSQALNAGVGGSPTSAHRFLTGACAADVVPARPGVTLRDLYDAVRQGGFAFDQLIWEYGTWVHIGRKGPAGRQGQSAEMIFRGTGYLPFNPDDPRVQVAA